MAQPLVDHRERRVHIILVHHKRRSQSQCALPRTQEEKPAPAPLTRQEIADLCGTTIETAIRVMSRWGKDGVVRTERDGFVLLDRAALEALALS